jgi:DNA helicase HerA-like ATPase
MSDGDASFLGTIQSVQGATLNIELALETISGLAFIRGYGYRIGQIGSFVRVPIGYLDLYGIISQVGAAAVPERLIEIEPFGRRWITVELVGEGTEDSGFRRGLSQYPTFGDRAYLVTEPDLARLYGRIDAPSFINLGHIAGAENIPALVDVNKLITRHSAVVGATGSGKSTTVAGLLTSLTRGDRFQSARVIILDIHGEYASALRDRAAVFRINSDARRDERALFVPYWAMVFDELQAMTFGQLEDTARAAVIQKVYDMKRQSIAAHPIKGLTAETITVDSPVPFSIHRLWLELHNLLNATHTIAAAAQESTTIAYEQENGQPAVGNALKVVPPRYRAPNQSAGADKIFLSGSPLNIRRQVEGLASKLRDPRYDFMFRPGELMPALDGRTVADLDALLREWIGGGAPITILDLSGVPAVVLTELVGVLLRITFDALFWARNLSEGGRERPLLVVLEEAHAYLGKGDSGPAAIAVQRIVKEGRKYGIGAMIVSQRPSEIDATILSQCGTIVAMRLANVADRAHVAAAVTDNLAGLLGMLPVLRTGEAIVVGEAVQLPVRAMVEPPALNRRPDSADPLVFDEHGPGGWNRRREPASYADVMEVWRTQNPTSPHLIIEE